MDEHLDGAISITDVASACGLSTDHFIRAFRRRMRTTPHRWLVERRVERARLLLRGSGSLAEIALACGFADQSHFTRVFTRMVGCPPGAWRRAIG